MKKKNSIKVMSVIMAASLTMQGMPVYASEATTEQTISVEETDSTSEETLEQKVVEEIQEISEEKKSEQEIVNEDDSSSESLPLDVEDVSGEEDNNGSEDSADIEDGSIEEHQHEYNFSDNGDGTHLKECTDMDCTDEAIVENHIFENGKCKCGAIENIESVQEYEYVGNCDGTHTKKYNGEKTIETCDFDEDGICTFCGDRKNVEKFTVVFVGYNEEKIAEKIFEKDYTLAEEDFPDAPDVEGYDCLAWTGVPEKITEDITIKAEYVKKSFSVTFLDNNKKEISSVKVKYNDSLKESDISDFSSENVKFYGWYTENGNKFDIKNPITEDITLIAKTRTIYDTTLRAESDGVKVTVRGNLPEGAELVLVNKNNEDYDSLYDDMTDESNPLSSLPEYFSPEGDATAALDISIMVDGVEYQPENAGEKVEVTLSNLEKTDSVQEVRHIDGETGEAEAIAEVDVNSSTVTFETDSFSVYTVGGVDYDTSAADKSYVFECGNGYVFGETLVVVGDTSNTGATVNVLGMSTDEKRSIKKIVSLNVDMINIPDKSGFSCCEEIISDGKMTSLGNSLFYNPAGQSSMKEINIPSEITKISQSAFYNCSNLETINLPNGLTSIQSDAFRNCTKLNNIVLSDNITEISSAAFYNCKSLSNIHIPTGMTRILPYTFYGCIAFSSITIPDNIVEIGHNAFAGCFKLSDINIGTGVTAIGAQAFYKDNGYYNEDNQWIVSNGSIKTALQTQNQVALDYDWELDHRLIDYDVIDSIKLIYNGNDVVEGLQPSISDFSIEGTFTNYKPNGIVTPNVKKDISCTSSQVSFEMNPFVLGQENVVTVSYTEDGVTKTDTTNVNCIAKSEISRTLNSITVTYTGESLYEDITLDINDIKVMGNYTVFYDNNTSEPKQAAISNSDVSINYPSKTTVGTNIITASYNNCRDYTTYTGMSKSEDRRELQSITAEYKGVDITVGTKPTNTDFITNAVFKVYYNNGKSDIQIVEIPGNQLDVTLPDTKLGTNEAIVEYTYNGVKKTARASYTGIAKTEQSRVLTGVTAEYTGGNVYVGKKADSSKVRVIAEYNVLYTDNSNATVNEVLTSGTDYTLDIPETTVLGNNNITVHILNVADSFKETSVIYKGVSKVELDRELKSIFAQYVGGNVYIGEELNKDAVKVTATYDIIYEDGSKVTKGYILDSSEFEVSNTIATADVNTAMVTFDGKSEVFTFPGIKKGNSNTTIPDIEPTIITKVETKTETKTETIEVPVVKTETKKIAVPVNIPVPVYIPVSNKSDATEIPSIIEKTSDNHVNHENEGIIKNEIVVPDNTEQKISGSVTDTNQDSEIIENDESKNQIVKEIVTQYKLSTKNKVVYGTGGMFAVILAFLFGRVSKKKNKNEDRYSH